MEPHLDSEHAHTVFGLVVVFGAVVGYIGRSILFIYAAGGRIRRAKVVVVHRVRLQSVAIIVGAWSKLRTTIYRGRVGEVGSICRLEMSVGIGRSGALL